MKNLITLFLVVVSYLSAVGQDPKQADAYADQITEDGLREYLTILASDALEGRETGTRGQKMAAAFIKSHFQDLGLTAPAAGDYFQYVTLYTSIPGDIYVKAGGKKYDNFGEVVYYGKASTEGEVTTPVVFVGGGEKSDFEQVNVEGKAVLIRLKPNETYWTSAALAREKKAKIVLVYYEQQDSYVKTRDQYKDYLMSGLLSLKKPEGENVKNAGLFFVSAEVASKIMNTPVEKLEKTISDPKAKTPLTKIKPGSFTYKTGLEIKTLKSENVLGFLEGTDKKDEIVVISAHYDHIGKSSSGKGDVINNGADDDGSGTVSLMQIARAFAIAKKQGAGPRRSILFLAVTGEEKGLLGSDFYTQYPIFPLANTVVDLNIDMVGRRDAQHKDSDPYVYVIGADKLSTKLNEVSESVNKKNHQLIFDYTYNDQNHPDRLYYRSDHYNFAKNNIPIIFYFDGIHEDYHKPSDEVDKIEFSLLRLRARTVFFTAWEIANMEERIKPDAVN